MTSFLNTLTKALNLDPAVSEFNLLLRIAEHVQEALVVSRYQIGSAALPIAQVPDDIAARVTLTNLLTPYLNAHGDVVDPNGTRYHLESRRYLFSTTNQASVNDVPVPGGLVLHLAHVAPDAAQNAKAQVTIAYIFHATDETPTITLLSDLQVGLLNAAALKTVLPR
jgi:hypothetical protein